MRTEFGSKKGSGRHPAEFSILLLTSMLIHSVHSGHSRLRIGTQQLLQHPDHGSNSAVYRERGFIRYRTAGSRIAIDYPNGLTIVEFHEIEKLCDFRTREVEFRKLKIEEATAWGLRIWDAGAAAR